MQDAIDLIFFLHCNALQASFVLLAIWGAMKICEYVKRGSGKTTGSDDIAKCIFATLHPIRPPPITSVS